MPSVPVGTTYVLRNQLGETAVVRGDSIVRRERRTVHAVGIEKTGTRQVPIQCNSLAKLCSEHNKSLLTQGVCTNRRAYKLTSTISHTYVNVDP